MGPEETILLMSFSSDICGTMTNCFSIFRGNSISTGLARIVGNFSHQCLDKYILDPLSGSGFRIWGFQDALAFLSRQCFTWTPPCNSDYRG